MGSRTNRARRGWPEFIAGSNLPFVKLTCDFSRAVTVRIPASPSFDGAFLARVHPAAREAFEALAAVMAHHEYLFREGSGGTLNCRKSANRSKNRSSLHAHGIAIDLNPGKNPFGSTRTDMPPAFVRDVLAIRTMSGAPVWIWGMEFKDPMHFEISASTRSDVATGIDWSTVAGRRGGDGGVTIPTLDDPTHRVGAALLNMRNEPSLGGRIVGRLNHGAPLVQTDEPERSGGDYMWANVKAVVGAEIVEGWVATDFIAAIRVRRPDSPGQPGLEGETHRVVAAGGLKLRPNPSTAKREIALLEEGTAVAAVVGTERDGGGYRWIEVRAIVGRVEQRGWVAAAVVQAGAVTKWYVERVVDLRLPDDATHRVVARRGLNVRPEPNTQSARIALLETGTMLVDLREVIDGDDEYQWMRVRASVGDRHADGWVASGRIVSGSVAEWYVEPID